MSTKLKKVKHNKFRLKDEIEHNQNLDKKSQEKNSN
jgi:hypothetical protein